MKIAERGELVTMVATVLHLVYFHCQVLVCAPHPPIPTRCAEYLWENEDAFTNVINIPRLFFPFFSFPFHFTDPLLEKQVPGLLEFGIKGTTQGLMKY